MGTADTSRMRQVKDGEIVVREGEQNNEMYKIISGKAAVYINYGKEDEYLLGIISEQRCFGETAILCKKPGMYTVEAISDMLLMRISEDEFEDFIKNNSNNAMDIIKNLAGEVVNLKCNLDMILQEISEKNTGEKINILELKQRMYHSAGSSQVSSLFNVRI